jgi:DNA polymerase III subunit delta'
MSRWAPLPWQQRQWQAVSAALAQQKLAHALLMVGPRGAGKRYFATRLARALLCGARTEDGAPCGRCRSCTLAQAGTHPDLFRLEKEEGSKVVKVDDLREFNRRVFLTPQLGKGLVGIIDPVDGLNRSSANALLKSLEEPPAGAHILLVGERWMSLPATLRSRCLILRFALPPVDEVAAMLAGTQPGDDTLLQPLRARYIPDERLHVEWSESLAALCGGREDPVVLAERWHKPEDRLPELLEWLHSCAADLIKLQARAREARLCNRSCLKPLREMADYLPQQALIPLAQLTLDTRRLLESQAKPQMLLENLLASWYQSARSRQGPRRGQAR